MAKKPEVKVVVELDAYQLQQKAEHYLRLIHDVGEPGDMKRAVMALGIVVVNVCERDE